MMQELLFWLYENQEASIKYQKRDIKFTFEIDDQLIDNSDLTLYESQGKIYRYTINIQTRVPLLRSENYFTVLHPNVEVIPTNNI